MNSVILTGANRGLGKAVHDSLVSQTLDHTICYFTTRKPVKNRKKDFLYHIVDFGDYDRNRPDIEIHPSSKVVVFINNAGSIAPICSAHKVSMADMEYAFRVNCSGPLALAQDLVMQTTEIGGRLFILNISSGAAKQPIKGWMAYCSSKAAIRMALDVLAEENNNVQVEHFDPGVMDTDMQRLIRSQSPDVMPDVDRFRDFKKDQVLQNPGQVAKRLIAIIQKVMQ